MIDPAIIRFFEEQKNSWLDEHAKKLEGNALEQKKIECDSIFDIATWLASNSPKAASRATTTHPSKFSHPDTGVGKKNLKEGTFVSPIIFEGKSFPDGFVRAGNVSGCAFDSVGDAGALKIESFLNVELDCDGKKLIHHLRDGTQSADDFIAYAKLDGEWLKGQLLAGLNKTSEEFLHTNSRIKQIYFPMHDSYHLLSILTNSGIVFRLKNKLDKMRFSDEVKSLREAKKNEQFSEHNYSEIYDITTIGYGGTKPQNISVMNNQNGGKALLLSSVPPHLSDIKARFPKSNFFLECLDYRQFKDYFSRLHKVMKTELGGVISRQNLLTARDKCIKELTLRIMDAVYVVREISGEQYSEASSLPKSQAIWLCANKASEREDSDAWLEEIIHQCTRWLNNAYGKSLGDNKMMLGNEEFSEIYQLIEQWTKENKEFLR